MEKGDRMKELTNEEIRERFEFFEQYTKHLEDKIDENYDMIRVTTDLLNRLVNKLLGVEEDE